MPSSLTRAMPPRPDFAATFSTLRNVLRTQAPKAVVVKDAADDFQVASPTRVDRVGRPLALGAVQIKKHYVSFHLVPVYAIPELAKNISPSLRKRMQGKSCFNFTTIEPAHVEELAALTKRGAAQLERVDLPWASTRR